MRMPALFALCAALSLAGCYESNGLLLDASAAQQPITQYQDWSYGSESKYHARLNPRSDGWYDYSEAKLDSNGAEGDWVHHPVLLNYLESDNNASIYVYGTYDESEKAYVYGLIVYEANGRWQSLMPSCDMFNADSDEALESDTQAAQSAGATVGTSAASTDICTFTSVGQLFQAMRNVVASPGFWPRVRKAQGGI